MIDIATCLLRRRFRYESESELQDGIEQALRDDEILYSREHLLTAHDRVDFMVGGGVAVEVKVKGTVKEVARQLHRYAQHPDVQAVVLVTSVAKHRVIPSRMCGKPVAVHWVSPL